MLGERGVLRDEHARVATIRHVKRIAGSASGQSGTPARLRRRPGRLIDGASVARTPRDPVLRPHCSGYQPTRAVLRSEQDVTGQGEAACAGTIFDLAVARSNQAARSTSGKAASLPDRGGHSISNVLLTALPASGSRLRQPRRRRSSALLLDRSELVQPPRVDLGRAGELLGELAKRRRPLPVRVQPLRDPDHAPQSRFAQGQAARVNEQNLKRRARPSRGPAALNLPGGTQAPRQDSTDTRCFREAGQAPPGSPSVRSPARTRRRRQAPASRAAARSRASREAGRIENRTAFVAALTRCLLEQG